MTTISKLNRIQHEVGHLRKVAMNQELIEYDDGASPFAALCEQVGELIQIVSRLAEEVQLND